MAAVITKNRKILSIKTNSLKSHPRQGLISKRGKRLPALTTHCELAAIIPLTEEQLKKSTIYVARQLANGSPGLARPCSTCFKIIKAAGIKKIIFTTNGPGFAIEEV